MLSYCFCCERQNVSNAATVLYRTFTCLPKYGQRRQPCSLTPSIYSDNDSYGGCVECVEAYTNEKTAELMISDEIRRNPLYAVFFSNFVSLLASRATRALSSSAFTPHVFKARGAVTRCLPCQQFNGGARAFQTKLAYDEALMIGGEFRWL